MQGWKLIHAYTIEFHTVALGWKPQFWLDVANWASSCICDTFCFVVDVPSWPAIWDKLCLLSVKHMFEFFPSKLRIFATEPHYKHSEFEIIFRVSFGDNKNCLISSCNIFLRFKQCFHIVTRYIGCACRWHMMNTRHNWIWIWG